MIPVVIMEKKIIFIGIRFKDYAYFKNLDIPFDIKFPFAKMISKDDYYKKTFKIRIQKSEMRVARVFCCLIIYNV